MDDDWEYPHFWKPPYDFRGIVPAQAQGLPVRNHPQSPGPMGLDELVKNEAKPRVSGADTPTVNPLHCGYSGLFTKTGW